jgi:hypothetical protein
MKIAYGMNRTEKQFRAAGVEADKFYLDNKMTGMRERLDMIVAAAKGVTVVVLSLADFGTGKAQQKAVRSIKATGATLEVAGDGLPASVGGRPSGTEWPSDEVLDRALIIWDALPAPQALALIEKDLGVVTNRNHMNHQRRKRARAKLNSK